MFKPNSTCYIRRVSGETDVYGMPVESNRYQEGCTMLKLDVRSEKSSVRADTSASRGNAYELQCDAEFLLTKESTVVIDDMLEFAGSQFRVLARFPRYDLQGRLDHLQIACNYWSAL